MLLLSIPISLPNQANAQDKGGAKIGDAKICPWVEDALRHDERVDADAIKVTAKRGIVTLAGSVPTLASEAFAVHEAEKIIGVRGVTNELALATESRDDADIVRDVEQRIAHNSTIVSKDLTVGCLDGYVTLSGDVADYSEELEAELVASEVRGVKQVQNHLLTTFIHKHNDAQTQRDVTARLARDVYLTQQPVTVAVKDSVVTLTGRVGSAYIQSRAGDDIRNIDHVQSVSNQLTVDPSINRDKEHQSVWPSEEDLQSALKTELTDDSRVDATKIEVTVQYGHVVLDGVARTHREKRIAELDARGIVGVHSVAYNLVVNGPQRDDTETAADASLDLESDAMLHDFDLKVKVKNGTITILGDVETLYERMHAEHVVGRVRGVQTIVDQVNVDRNDTYDDAQLGKEIEMRWKHDKETRRCQLIKVEVVNGVAVLTGTVDSWAAHQEAAHVAFLTDGIWKVQNNIVVEGFDYPWEDLREAGHRDFDPADPQIHQYLFG